MAESEVAAVERPHDWTDVSSSRDIPFAAPTMDPSRLRGEIAQRPEKSISSAAVFSFRVRGEIGETIIFEPAPTQVDELTHRLALAGRLFVMFVLMAALISTLHFAVGGPWPALVSALLVLAAVGALIWAKGQLKRTEDGVIST